MNKNKKWLLAISLATMITANGVAMAANVSEQQDIPNGQRHAFAAKGDFRKLGSMQEFRGFHTALLELLKVDAETFKAEIKAGKSLVTIAKEHGVSERALKKFMVGQMTQRIEEGVKAGRISQDQAKEMKAKMEERVSAMINGQGSVFVHKGQGPMHGHKHFNHSELLALLKMDAETFKAEIKDGKSLVMIAKEHGLSERALKKFMVGQMTQRIEEGVKAGKISQDQAKEMKAKMEQRVAEMINGKHPMRGHRFGA